MNKRVLPISLIAIILTGLFLAACSTASPEPTVSAPPTATSEEKSTAITLTDGLGREITLEQPAESVISLAPSNTEIFFAIGAGDQLVGRDSLSDFPAEAANVPDIGGGFGELNMETILAAEPDLVLAADLTPPEQIQALEEVGLTVFALPNPVDFDGLYVILGDVAKLVGHEDAAVAVVEQLKSRVAAVQGKVSSASDHPVVFYELDSTDPNAPWTTGPGTFIDTLILTAGGKNFGASLEGAWVQVSIEELLTRDPDIILLGDYTWGGVTPEDVAARAGWDELSAIKNAQVFTFDDNLVSRPGPRLVDGLEAMAKLLHPELFE